MDYCTTRLRLSVQDANVVDDKTLKQTGARGVMRISKTNVQVIIGTSVEFLAEAMKERLKKAIQHQPTLNFLLHSLSWKRQ